MVGQSITKLLPPDRLDEEAQILARLHRGERVEHYETIRRRKDGRLIDVSLTISPIRNDEGVIVGASKIARDITDQKEALRRLAEAHEQLKRADTMKAEFLATLSHELRTPLNAILGWVQILKEGPTPEEVAEGVPIIERNVRAQAQLIEDLLDMSRIEAGKVAWTCSRSIWPRSSMPASRPCARPLRPKKSASAPPSRASTERADRRRESPAAGRLEPADQCRQIHAQGRPGPRRHGAASIPTSRSR